MSTILIVGKYDVFITSLIDKFYINKWDVYLLTNEKSNKHRHVFEQYTFDYSSDIVKDVINSCRPNVILFSGAYDSSYNWGKKNLNKEALRYISDLSNIVAYANSLRVPHFIYLSSQEVFEDKYMIDIIEDMNVNAQSDKSTAISIGEYITSSFDASTNIETTIARLDNMYGKAKDRETSNDFYSRMCIEALVKGRIRANVKLVFSSIYINDAVEALYILVDASERKHNLYHLSSMEELTQHDAASIIKDNSQYQVEIIDQSKGLKNRIVLSNRRFCDEFEFVIKNNYKDTMPDIIKYINLHKRRYMYADEKEELKERKYYFYNLTKKITPYMESLLLFIVVFVLNNILYDNFYLQGINLYLLYVILFSLVYGKHQGTFSSMLSVIGIVIGQVMHSDDISFIINPTIYTQIVQLFLVGLSVGHLKDKYNKMNLDMKDEVYYLTDKLEDMIEINTSNKRIKDYYIDKMFNSEESIGYIYNITSKLQNSEKGEVLFDALDTLMDIMATEDAAIYLVSNEDFCRLASYSSEKAASLGKSINMNNYSSIFKPLKNKHVYINRELDQSLPMMSSSLFDDNNNMRIIIFLWDLPYDKMTLYYTNLLTVVGAIVYSAFLRDANYLDALAYSRYIEGTTILREDAFKEMVGIYKRAEEKGYSESCIIGITNNNEDLIELNKKTSPLLRETDYIGIMSDGSLAVLLTNTNSKDARYVIERLKNVYVEAKII